MNNSRRVVQTTGDGSPTIAIPALNITYHSKHGAIRESEHVFVKSGLDKALSVFPDDGIHIFEMGFGTGLNALLTAIEAARRERLIRYTSVELYPLTATEVLSLSYDINDEATALFAALHKAAWQEIVPVNNYFNLHKIPGDLLTISLPGSLHLVYYDAFAPEDQPDLWTEAVFKKLFDALVPGGILVTYCSKSVVRKAMQAAGFHIEKIPGPPGKREIVRASKPV